MKTHRFLPAERFGVWEAHKGACYWCDTPISFREATIDHIVPESLSSDELTQALAHYGLPRTFGVNDYANWVPAHGSCNSSKGNRIFDAAPAMIKALDDAQRRAPRARSIAEGILKDRKRSKVLSILEQARADGTVGEAEILELFRVAAIAPPTGPVDLGESAYEVSPSITIIRRDFNRYRTASSGILGAFPGAPSPFMSGPCPGCGACDQWGGNVCLSCFYVVVCE